MRCLLEFSLLNARVELKLVNGFGPSASLDASMTLWFQMFLKLSSVNDFDYGDSGDYRVEFVVVMQWISLSPSNFLFY